MNSVSSVSGPSARHVVGLSIGQGREMETGTQSSCQTQTVLPGEMQSPSSLSIVPDQPHSLGRESYRVHVGRCRSGRYSRGRGLLLAHGVGTEVLRSQRERRTGQCQLAASREVY